MVFPANLLRDISKIKPSFDNMKASTNQKNYSKHYKKSSGLHYATVRATQDYNCLHTTQHCKEVNIQNRKKPHTFFLQMPSPVCSSGGTGSRSDSQSASSVVSSALLSPLRTTFWRRRISMPLAGGPFTLAECTASAVNKLSTRSYRFCFD